MSDLKEKYGEVLEAWSGQETYCSNFKEVPNIGLCCTERQAFNVSVTIIKDKGTKWGSVLLS